MPIYAPTFADFGGVGGGADDTAAFTSAIAANIPVLLIGAGTFTIDCGRYNITGPRIILGSGKERTVIKFAPGTFGANGTCLSISSRSDVVLRDLCIDASDVEQTSGLSSIIGALLLSGWTVERVWVIGSGSGIVCVSGNAVQRYNVCHSVLELDVPSANQNQALLISSASGASTLGVVEDNVCVNSAINVSASYTLIDNNDVSGWAFGGGITTEVSATYSHHLTISDNTLHDSEWTIDINDTAACGIEHWSPDSVISGNVAFNCGSEGFSIGGQRCTVDGNTAYNNGRRIDGGKASGFATRYSSADVNGNNSVYSGNIAYDNATGSQQYGYSDQTSGVSGVVVNDGTLLTGPTGATNILGDTIVNP